MFEYKKSEDIPSDLYTFQSWMYVVAGYGESRNPIYITYSILAFVLQLYVLAMSVLAAYIVMPSRVLTALALHVTLILLYSLGLVVSRHAAHRSLKETNRMINNGIYDYKDEEIDEKQASMKNGIEEEIRKITTVVIMLFASGAISNLALFPLIQLLFYREESENPYHNPYLPPFFYFMPFKTRSLHGYCLAYLLIATNAITLYAVTLSSFAIYIHTTLKLKGHLKILNYSLNNIHKRAYLKYKKKFNLQDYDSSEEVFEKEDFQACVYSCFKANVEHHHALMKFREAFQPFVGAFFLDVYVSISLIYAALFFLILQNLPITFLATFIETLLSEQSGLVLMCYMGETVSEESKKLFETLYAIPWTRCNKKINRSIKIMMSNTFQPIKIKALLLDSAAVLTSYCDFMMNMYKIMNLFRQSDLG